MTDEATYLIRELCKFQTRKRNMALPFNYIVSLLVNLGEQNIQILTLTI